MQEYLKETLKVMKVPYNIDLVTGRLEDWAAFPWEDYQVSMVAFTSKPKPQASHVVHSPPRRPKGYKPTAAERDIQPSWPENSTSPGVDDEVRWRLERLYYTRLTSFDQAKRTGLEIWAHVSTAAASITGMEPKYTCDPARQK